VSVVNFLVPCSIPMDKNKMHMLVIFFLERNVLGHINIKYAVFCSYSYSQIQVSCTNIWNSQQKEVDLNSVRYIPGSHIPGSQFQLAVQRVKSAMKSQLYRENSNKYDC